MKRTPRYDHGTFFPEFKEMGQRMYAGLCEHLLRAAAGVPISTSISVAPRSPKEAYILKERFYGVPANGHGRLTVGSKRAARSSRKNSPSFTMRAVLQAP